MRTRSHDTDSLIITLLQTGDARSMPLLYAHYYTPLLHVLQRYGFTRTDADDLVQELFIALWEKREHLQPTLPLYRYLKTAIVHRAHNYKRNQRRSKEMRMSDVESLVLYELQLPDALLHRTDIRQLWRAALKKLPVPLRRVVILYGSFPMRQHDIAQRLRLSPKTVGKRLAKALAMLRILFKAYINLMLFCLL